jgi:hypothetical protein
MTDHAHWLTSYQQIRIVHGRLKNAAIKELSAVEIDECAERRFDSTSIRDGERP